MTDCVFEIPDEASATEDSGSPIRNVASSRTTPHVESRSPHDVPDLRAIVFPEASKRSVLVQCALLKGV